MDTPSMMQYVFLVLLLIGSAFCSASETAFSTVNPMRLKNLIEEGNAKAARTLKISEDYDHFLTTVLVGNNIVNIATSSLGTVMASMMFGTTYGPVISTVVITILVLIFGEILPKSYAKEHSEQLALRFTGIIYYMMKIFKPVVMVFLAIKRLTLSNKNQAAQPYVTENELKYIIETIEEEGVLEEQESDLVQSALDFDEITAQEIITPRVDLTAVSIHDPIDEITKVVMEGRFSRIPAYDKTIDNIVGVIYVREYLTQLAAGKEIVIQDLLHECPFVHKTMKISAMLNELKRSKTHMAVVTDDYGGTMGIVTMEDILEELVGEIWDESDQVENSYQRKDENTYEVCGDMNIEDMFDLLDVSCKNLESDYTTVGGWSLEMLGHIPEAGESFEYENLKVTVLLMEDQRVLRLLVEKIPQTEPVEQDA